MGNDLVFCCNRDKNDANNELNHLFFLKQRATHNNQDTLEKSKAIGTKDGYNKKQDIYENYIIDKSNPEYKLDIVKFGSDVELDGLKTGLGQENNFLEVNHHILKEFLLNPESTDQIDINSLLESKVKETRSKSGKINEDCYLKPLFLNVTNDGNNQINISPVWIDKEKKNEIYFGQWKLNKNIDINKNIKNLNTIMNFNGFGILIKEDKSISEGIFKDGELQGPGRVILANGDLLKGNFTKGLLNDEGIFIDYSGNEYKGMFKDNVMDGKGEEYFVDKSFFKGEYVKNKKNGKGKFVWGDGSFYEGDLVNNNLDGKGIYKWASGLHYEGEWCKGLMQGNGILKTSIGEYYEGEFKDNKKHGFGLFWWNENKYFVGYWKDGLQDGQGKFFKNEKKMIGTWKKGKFENHLEQDEIYFPKFEFKKIVKF